MPINERDIERLKQAGRRWQARSSEHAATLNALDTVGPAAADTAERVRANVVRRRALSTRAVLATVEAVIGETDIVELAPTPAALLAAGAVARIVTRPSDDIEMTGFGTGFVIAPGVLLTNNHVLPDFDAVQRAAAHFGYARTERGVARGKVVNFSGLANMFVTSEELDFTIVALEQDPGVGFHPLLGSIGKILKGHRISIIQHPGGGPRKYAVEGNQLVDVLPDYLHYVTDTEYGSSGSPAFNDRWEVVALHHSRVPKMVGDTIMAKGGVPWNSATMTENDVDWVANEGVRVSRIIERIKIARGREPQVAALLDQVLVNHELDARETRSFNALASAPTLPQTPLGETMTTTINIHGPATIYTASFPPSSAPAGNLLQTAPDASTSTTLDAFEGVSIDPNYDARPGYAENFLGAGFAVQMPALSVGLQAQVAPLKNGNAAGVLKYHHFSIVMHATRKLALFTAVNIDGKTSKRIERSGDKWFFDPRMDRNFQIGEDLYRANPLDRGHLVRRLDPVWGKLKIAKFANDDTFHFTNCSPQHANLNQKIWVDLENYLLDNADDDNVRLSVFTGPILLDSDPEYRAVKLPRRFWKVAVMRAQDGNLLAAGFVQSQTKMIRGLREADFLSQETRTDQFKISQIEALTGLTFNIPPEADPLHGEANLPMIESVSAQGKPLSDLEEIKLRP